MNNEDTIQDAFGDVPVPTEEIGEIASELEAFIEDRRDRFSDREALTSDEL